ncbi:hypothetical protein GN156_33185, partial [bacterium LRH843]|nr:hypothetical protein [bacterium LRH843]
LESIGVEGEKETNRAKKAEGPTEDQIEKLKELYKADYDLFNEMEDKLWRP